MNKLYWRTLGEGKTHLCAVARMGLECSGLAINHRAIKLAFYPASG